MHKQLLSTAFSAFLALALVICIISPTAEDAEWAAQDTKAPVTEPSVTEPPVTEPCETDSPVTEPPVTEPCETDSPVTDPPETSAAETVPPEPEAEKACERVLPTLPEDARPLSLYINGRAIECGFCFEHGGVIWLPIEGFGELFGSDVISGEVGECYIESADRSIPCSKSDPELCVREFGVPCAPIEPLLSAAGLKATEIVGGEICIWGAPTFPEANDVYSYEDLYWLSRIISAESRGEPFVGQLAVGTVVINRTRSDYYPDTIYEVIFDRLGGVQFTPASTGSVYREPTDSSVLAAKLCLEGFSLDPTILFFFNSSIAKGSWITANRTYTMTVGQHDFYS